MQCALRSDAGNRPEAHLEMRAVAEILDRKEWDGPGAPDLPLTES